MMLMSIDIYNDNNDFEIKTIIYAYKLLLNIFCALNIYFLYKKIVFQKNVVNYNFCIQNENKLKSANLSICFLNNFKNLYLLVI